MDGQRVAVSAELSTVRKVSEKYLAIKIHFTSMNT